MHHHTNRRAPFSPNEPNSGPVASESVTRHQMYRTSPVHVRYHPVHRRPAPVRRRFGMTAYNRGEPHARACRAAP